MKAIIFSLLKRNSLAAMVFVLLLVGLHLAPHRYIPSGLFWIVLPAFFGSLFWANLPLYKRGHKTAAVLVSLAFVPLLGFPVGVSSFIIGKKLTEREYKARGLEMVTGCNLAAASSANFDVYALDERLGGLTNTPYAAAHPKEMAELLNARTMAQERLDVLAGDCRLRGHRDSHPWKSDWSKIKQALTDSEEWPYDH